MEHHFGISKTVGVNYQFFLINFKTFINTKQIKNKKQKKELGKKK